jgi:hypothetical protein
MKRLSTIIAGIAALLVIAGTASYFLYFREGAVLKPSGDYSEYSAVALTSNELFFGRITKQNDQEIVLEDVYFFTFVSENGQTSTGSNAANANENLRPTLIDTAASDSIAPTTTYVLNRDQVKYTYPLKGDSTVVKTVNEYKNKK